MDAKAFIYANVPRLIWITDTKVLGGYLGLDALVPLQYTDLNISAGLIRHDHDTSASATCSSKAPGRAHLKQFDFALGYGRLGADGRISDSPRSPRPRAGLGYWTHMLTAGATWYIDNDKRWALSALNRYEFSTEKEDTEHNPRPGLYRWSGA